ncbi:hypothetical protein [Paenibacillus sp. USDA918EY]|uniref:hypothetical protein n=1 Tax=Paenibacillus sp. USDA918EY TaxID=2689575 RepID=UPI001F22A59D|nr:hypothetical protein [Paenibacillus sp. USDA918EY]
MYSGDSGDSGDESDDPMFRAGAMGRRMPGWGAARIADRFFGQAKKSVISAPYANASIQKMFPMNCNDFLPGGSFGG